jgi:type IV secretion system protein VirD4
MFMGFAIFGTGIDHTCIHCSKNHTKKIITMLQLINGLFSVLFELFGSILTGISDVIVTAVSSNTKTEYTASFGRESEMLSKNGNGFTIGEWSNSLQESHNHMICIGQSGSKKSSSVVFNTILNTDDASIVITDPSKELLYGTAKALEAKGYKIMVLDYNNAEQSEGFSVLSKQTTYTEIYKIANTLVRNSLEGSSYDYWSQSAETTIAFFCKYLVSYAEEQYVNLPNVLHLLRVFSHTPKLIDALMVKTNPNLLNEYKAIIATPDKTLQSTLATAKNALRVYESPSIEKITSHNTINFEDFRKKKIALYICSSASESFLYRAITATFFESFFSHILSGNPSDTGLPIKFIIDEASQIKISLSQALSLTRKYNISIATFWQDIEQIENVYGKHEASNIYTNSGLKVFMPGGHSLAICKNLSETLGKYSYQTEEGHEKVRELLTPQEIYTLKEALVLYGNKAPLRIIPKQYFQISKMKKQTELPRYIPKTKVNSIETPFLPVEITKEEKKEQKQETAQTTAIVEEKA